VPSVGTGEQDSDGCFLLAVAQAKGMALDFEGYQRVIRISRVFRIIRVGESKTYQPHLIQECDGRVHICTILAYWG
jgi:hypothetical protein